MDISNKEITSKKVRRIKVEFWTTEITSKNIRGNNMNFSTIEITWKKVRENISDFSTREITLKKYVEMMCKFVEIWSLTYQGNINVELTSIPLGMPVRFNCK